MIWPVVLPFALGFAAVLQAAINRQVGNHWGTLVTSAASGVVLALTAMSIFAIVRLVPTFHGAGVQPISNPAWWWLLPGVLGFGLVAGLPLAMDRIGATRVFLLMVAGQMVASLAWDTLSAGRGVNLVRLAGVGLAVVGATLVCISD